MSDGEARAIPTRFNIAEACLARGRTEPERPALRVVADAQMAGSGAEHWTYGELDEAVRRVAEGLLAEGLEPGDRLMIRMPNCSDYALLFFGAMAAGIVPVPVSAQLTGPEMAILLADCEPAAIAQETAGELGSGGVPVLDGATIQRLKAAEPLPAYADTAAEDPAYMIYTSGSSGRPKGVVHAHRVLIGREPMRRHWQAIGPDDVMLHAGAFNWSYTLGVGMLDPWASGATAVLYAGSRDIAVWPRLMADVGATLFAAVPSLYRQMLKYCDLSPRAFPTLRHCLAAGEALDANVLAGWQAVTGRPIYEALGMSECSTFVSSGPGVPARPGSAGKPQHGRRIAILPLAGGTVPLPRGETGLLGIDRGDPGLMLGYWRRPEEDGATRRGDWFIGGDLAALDDDGYLWHRGRADDVMNAGGFRVSPVEVETALLACPGVAEVAVSEHRVRPEVSIIAAYVVRNSGAKLDARAILDHAATRLAEYKRPREVFFVEHLPRGANGKLLRRGLG